MNSISLNKIVDYYQKLLQARDLKDEIVKLINRRNIKLPITLDHSLLNTISRLSGIEYSHIDEFCIAFYCFTEIEKMSDIFPVHEDVQEGFLEAHYWIEMMHFIQGMQEHFQGQFDSRPQSMLEVYRIINSNLVSKDLKSTLYKKVCIEKRDDLLWVAFSNGVPDAVKSTEILIDTNIFHNLDNHFIQGIAKDPEIKGIVPQEIMQEIAQVVTKSSPNEGKVSRQRKSFEFFLREYVGSLVKIDTKKLLQLRPILSKSGRLAAFISNPEIEGIDRLLLIRDRIRDKVYQLLKRLDISYEARNYLEILMLQSMKWDENIFINDKFASSAFKDIHKDCTLYNTSLESMMKDKRADFFSYNNQKQKLYTRFLSSIDRFIPEMYAGNLIGYITSHIALSNQELLDASLSSRNFIKMNERVKIFSNMIDFSIESSIILLHALFREMSRYEKTRFVTDEAINDSWHISFDGISDLETCLRLKAENITVQNLLEFEDSYLLSVQKRQDRLDVIYEEVTREFNDFLNLYIDDENIVKLLKSRTFCGSYLKKKDIDLLKKYNFDSKSSKQAIKRLVESSSRFRALKTYPSVLKDMNVLLKKTVGLNLSQLRSMYQSGYDFSQGDFNTKFDLFKKKMTVGIDETGMLLQFDGIDEGFKKDFDRNDLVYLLKSVERGVVAFTNNTDMRIQSLKYPQIAFLLRDVVIINQADVLDFREFKSLLRKISPTKKYHSPCQKVGSPQAPKRNSSYKSGTNSAYKPRVPSIRRRNPSTPSGNRSSVNCKRKRGLFDYTDKKSKKVLISPGFQETNSKENLSDDDSLPLAFAVQKLSFRQSISVKE